MSLEFKPGSAVDPKRAVRFGAWRVAEYRFYAMSKWLTSVIVFGFGNPILYLISVGLGIGALVDANTGGGGILGVPYIQFVAPALLASAAIQGVMEWTTYNLWGMKEPDYVMQMMATGGLLDANKSCRMASPRWNDGGVNIHARLIGNFGIGMQWTITTTFSTDCHRLRTAGILCGGRIGCLVLSWLSPR
jgi:hypothetical protein